VCDIIEKKNITNEQDIDSIIGALLYDVSLKKGFSITKHKKLEILTQTELMIMKFQKFNYT